MVKGDFSRNPTAEIATVLFQQGKPLVEADLNEALTAIRENQRVQLFFAQDKCKNKDQDNRTYTPLNGFALSVGGDKQLRISPGICQVLGNLLKNPEEMVATSFKQLNEGAAEGKRRYIAILKRKEQSPKEDDPTSKIEFPPAGDYVVTLVTSEKPLLHSEVDHRAPSKIGTLQASVLHEQHWHFVLEQVAEKAFQATRNRIIERNSVLLERPAPEGEAVKAFSPLSPLQTKPHAIMVSMESKNQARLPAGLYRFEIHEITKDNTSAVQQIEFKVGFDNAARALQLRKVSDSIVAIASDQFGLPKPKELLELELESKQARPDLDVFGKLHAVTSAEANGLIPNSAFKDLTGDWDKAPLPQVRIWHSQGTFKLESKLKSEPEPESKPKPSEFFMRVNIGDFVVRFMCPKNELAEFLKGFRKGDYWVVHSSHIATEPPLFDAVEDSQANDEQLTELFRKWSRGGQRWGIFYAPLMNVTSDGNATLSEVKGNGNSAPTPAPPVMPASLSWTRDAQLASSVPCRNLFSRVECLAAKRWLASMTFGELAALTKEQLRRRIEQDSLPQEFTPQALERDLNEIVARRQQLLSLEHIA